MAAPLSVKLGQPSWRLKNGAVETFVTRSAGMEEAILHRMTPRAPLTDLGHNYRGLRLLDMARESLEASGVATRGLMAPELAQRAHAITAASQYLVRISLVAHIPDDAVIRRVEHMVQGDGELDRAQVGRQMPAGLRHAVQQVVAQLGGQRVQLAAREPTHVG
jgi:hypothetical protein